MKRSLAIGKKKSLTTRIWKARTGYLLLLPLFVCVFVFGYYPPLSGILHSFYDWIPGKSASFIGLANYRDLFSDPIFFRSIPPMLIFTFSGIAIALVVPFFIAEIIYNMRNRNAQYSYRVLLLLPMVVPGVVGILLWKFIYDPNQGLVNTLAHFLHLVPKNYNVDILGEPNLARLGVIFFGFPWVNGINVLIYLAGLMNIPTEVLDSVRLDGATGLRRIIHIDIPYLMGQIRYFLITGIVFWLQNYNLQLILTRGGPGDKTNVPAYYMFIAAFDYHRFGYGATIGTVLFIVIFFLSLLTLRYIRSQFENA